MLLDKKVILHLAELDEYVDRCQVGYVRVMVNLMTRNEVILKSYLKDINGSSAASFRCTSE